MNIYDENTLTSRSKITQPTIISLDIKNALQIIETGRNWTHRDQYSLAPGFQLLSRKQRVISRASNRVNCLPTTSKRNWCGTKRGHGRRSRRRGGRRASNGMSEKEEAKRERERRGEKTLRVYERVRWKIRGSSLTTIQPPPRLVSFSFTRCLQRGYFYRGHHHSEKISSRPRTRVIVAYAIGSRVGGKERKMR